MRPVTFLKAAKIKIFFKIKNLEHAIVVKKLQEKKTIMFDLKLIFCISKSEFSWDPNFPLEAI